METGHHQVRQVCEYLKSTEKEIDRLVFVHHGLKVLHDPEGARREVAEFWGEQGMITEDGDVIEL